MSPWLEELQAALDARDIETFLVVYERQPPQTPVETLDLPRLTQRLLPPVLLDVLQRGQLSPAGVRRLRALTNDHRLAIMDDDVRAAINDALAGAQEDGKPPLAPLPLWRNAHGPQAVAPAREAPLAVTNVRRVVIASAFTFGCSARSDDFGYRKSVCASPQEREFLKAVRQFFPSLRAYPNVPLRNFIATDDLGWRLVERERNFAWAAQVDILLCTEDEDPVAGIELDSSFHDEDEARERDALKDKLFALADIPLVRIRATNPGTVRAEDFFDLLQHQAEELDALRPRRLRPRRDHDFLVPAEVLARSSPLRL